MKTRLWMVTGAAALVVWFLVYEEIQSEDRIHKCEDEIEIQELKDLEIMAVLSSEGDVYMPSYPSCNEGDNQGYVYTSSPDAYRTYRRVNNSYMLIE